MNYREIYSYLVSFQPDEELRRQAQLIVPFITPNFELDRGLDGYDEIAPYLIGRHGLAILAIIDEARRIYWLATGGPN